VIVNEIKSTKVARFNLAAEFREKSVKKLFIFFNVLKKRWKKVKNIEEIIFFAKLTFFHASQLEKKSFFHAEITFFTLELLFFTLYYFFLGWKLQREKK
jgi:hypothetical protein